MRTVRLTPVDERLLQPLLSVAVAETKPDEVASHFRCKFGLM